MSDKGEFEKILQGKDKDDETEDEELPVPKEQEWLEDILYQQTEALKGINGKLTFIVVIIILGIILSLLRGCGI